MPNKKGSISTNLHMPRDTKKYQARKIQGMIRRLEGEAAGKVNMKDYVMLLDRFATLTDDIRKDRKARGINKKHSAPEVLTGRDAGAEPKQPTDVGADIRAENKDPFEGLSDV